MKGPSARNPALFFTGAAGIRSEITLRDLFAAAYLMGHINNAPEEVAEDAYAHADAMLAERTK